ncbi:hypothetical protein E4U13_007964 [Claviceps humidiphila]|uniref:AGA1 A-agglutinin anchor subunit n=1 Tax=Claviceps humidiphila TaxID=1294629 RepID=A0A9P7Q575_9HYPO|nr:hypothetical protein E4U13_007964 [Claviceps humidiphila]
MSSLQRTRSLRKPTNQSSLPADSASSAPRSVSPSRLPLKPASRPRPRPLSIHGSATTASTTANTTTTTNTTRTTRSASTQLARTTSLSQKQAPPLPAQDPTKKDSRYAPLRSATRSASGGSTTTRPTSAGGPGTRPTRAPIPTHTRAKSTVTSLSAATALRPNLSSRDVSTSLKRGHGRSVSVDKASCATPIRQQQPQQQQQTHREKQPCSPTTAVASKPHLHLRPAFSTLQQHYSPAKTQAPKPLTSAILAPPSPSKLPANIAASAAASKLQAELLQLHLLHRDAGAVYAEWQASAEDTLRDRFHGLKVGSGEVAERERSALEGENMLALRQWARGGAAGRDLEGRIQVLDEVVTSLWVLSEPAGRYARLVRRFERFVDRACDAEDARGSSLGEGEGEGLDGLFVEELDAGWKGEVAMLTRRLEMWKGQFQSIDDFVGSGTGIAAGEGGSASALERMLEGVRGLLQGMLDELFAMEEMEALVLAREEAWIERMNMREEEQQDGEVEAGAIWRVV